MDDVDMQQGDVPVIGFVGYSGSGKTSLLTQVISQLSVLQMRVGVIKHAHHQFDIDKPGKDSYVLRHAGAEQTIVASKSRWALMVETPGNEQDPMLSDLIKRLDKSTLDMILVEGFKHVRYPKIEIHRPELNKPLLCLQDTDIIAVATNSESAIPLGPQIPILDLQNAQSIIRFILNYFGIRDD